MADKVIKFPPREFILRCRKCKVNAFYVILNSNDPCDYKYHECTECGDLFFIKGYKKLMEEISNG